VCVNSYRNSGALVLQNLETSTLRSSSCALRLLVARSESVGNKSIWVMNGVSESFTNDMKAQAIAAKQYRLVPGQFIILAFLAPSTLVLGRDFSRFDSPLYEV